MADNYTIEDVSDPDSFCAGYQRQIKKNCINTESSDKCWIWQKSLNDGYPHMSYTFRVNGVGSKKKYTNGHRLMYAVTYNILEILLPHNKELQVSHRCHNPVCCNPAHLELETPQENGSRTVCANMGDQGQCHHEPPCLLNKCD